MGGQADPETRSGGTKEPSFRFIVSVLKVNISVLRATLSRHVCMSGPKKDEACELRPYTERWVVDQRLKNGGAQGVNKQHCVYYPRQGSDSSEAFA